MKEVSFCRKRFFLVEYNVRRIQFDIEDMCLFAKSITNGDRYHDQKKGRGYAKNDSNYYLNI